MCNNKEYRSDKSNDPSNEDKKDLIVISKMEKPREPIIKKFD